MTAPVMLWCHNVPASLSEMEIADIFWDLEIAWVSMVSIVKTADPETNCVYVQISGWKGDIAYEIHYRKFGAINTPIGWFCATDIVLHEHVEKADFPISYYLRPPVRYIGEPQLAPLKPVACETAPDCNHMYCYKVDAEELIAIQKFHEELAAAWDQIQYNAWDELQQETLVKSQADAWNQLQTEPVVLPQETDELRQKRDEAYAGAFIETGYKVTPKDHWAWQEYDRLTEEQQLRGEVSGFIRNYLYPRPTISDSITLKDMINMLGQVIEQRTQELTEQCIHHDDWPDDEILGQAQEYIYKLVLL